MDRSGYLVLTNNRSDIADWLEEMAGNGWKLISVDQGIFYFESIEMSTARTAEALLRDARMNGPMREVLNTAAEAGIARAKRERG